MDILIVDYIISVQKIQD